MIVWDLQAIEAAFADAGLNPATWKRALNIVTTQTDAFGAVLIPVTGGILPNIPCSDRMRESLRAYFRGDVRVDPNRGAIIEDLRNADPTGLGWCASIKVKCGDDLWCLSIQRSPAQRPFSPEEKRKMAELSPSLSSAFAISRAFGLATTKAALDAFEVSDTAVLLIDRLGKVIRANPSAEQLLKGDVKLSRGKLVSKDQNAARAVEQALYKVLRTSEAALATPIALPRDWQRPLLVYLFKLPSLSGNPLSECQAIAVIIDPDRRWVPTETTLRASFGFTPAEARLVARILSGAALDEAAVSLGITTKTGKNRLLNIFAKAGVHRQAELVALVGSTARAARGAWISSRIIR